ncbi:hypothetical protein MVEN_01719400 [Mycena venus]|uniref:AT hook domain-containing protein family protein n=1 Tax=Mycena venus TaxID=2733690 RepID=A0A8H6XM93_9AGAR|nr:hypothetical protein MVEN_01719400 [Mycena venus]
MSDSTRRLRSASSVDAPSVSSPTVTTPVAVLQIIKPGSRLPGLKSSELTLLREKQRKLKAQALSTLESLPNDSPQMRTALEASLIFAQEEAGSAVCVDPAGWVLTCAHCIGETEEEYRQSPTRWLLFYTGIAVRVECRAWDVRRDLALLKITAVESAAPIPSFPFLRPSPQAPAKSTPIVCIGQPGQDDLESSSARRTNYPFIFVSEGAFRGMVRGADPHDNTEIGTLKHDAWTYWGHSGAPLIHAAEGTLIGLHSSWDDRTAMRHGVPHAAIQAFLQIHLNV